MRISDWSSDVCSSDLKKALGFHFVAIDEVIDQFGRVILAAQRNLLHRVRHDLHKRRRWQPVEGVLDGAAVVDRKSTRLTPVTNAQLVCRLLLEKKKSHITP